MKKKFEPEKFNKCMKKCMKRQLLSMSWNTVFPHPDPHPPPPPPRQPNIEGIVLIDSGSVLSPSSRNDLYVFIPCYAVLLLRIDNRRQSVICGILLSSLAVAYILA